MKYANTRLLRAFRQDHPLFRCGFAGMLVAASPFYIAAGMDIASGLGRFTDVILLYSAIILMILIGYYLSGRLLFPVRLKLPKFFIGGAVSIYAALVIILHIGEVNWIGASVIACIVMLAGFLFGSSIYVLYAVNKLAVWRIGYVIFSLAAFFVFLMMLLFGAPPLKEPDYLDEALQQSPAYALPVENPGLPGKYAIRTFTYGSGYDRQRKKFGEEAEVITPAVDASAIIKEWDWSRKWLWGYESDQLPLNGTVWMPVGEGPFPLILIVHGNHSMADYSDEGYAYLGELLASRGFIAISVDENFINYSTWEGGLDTLSEDMTIRAWLLLQHLAAIDELNHTAGTPFSGKVDMERIALIGHSRGGQAAVLAAHFDQFFASDKYEGYRVNRDFGIDAVVALAPTDMSVYERNLAVNNINYLLLQGSNDADVNTFFGDRQYKRIGFTDGDYRIKSSLYIGGANHGQFNTDWRRRDIGLPTQLFLNKSDLLAGEDQRTIAKVYISAFLETLFHSANWYEAMFRDYRHALAWLPETQYVSRYMNSDFRRITDAEEDMDKNTGNYGAAISALAMSTWTEEDLKNRLDSSQMNRVIRLGPGQAGAAYTLDFGTSGPFVPLTEDSLLSFALGGVTFGVSMNQQLHIEISDAYRTAARLGLESYAPVPEPVTTRFLKAPYLEKVISDGELGTTSEPVLQTFLLPLSAWKNAAPDLRLDCIRRIRFIVEEPDAGEFMLDEIGFYSS